MDALNLPWLLTLSVTLVVVSYLLFRERLRVKNLLTEIHRLKLESAALMRGSVGVGNRLHKVCDELQGLKQKCRVLENQKSLPTYDQACHLIELGASVEDLMSHCSYPRGEAELLISLSKKKRRQSNNLRSLC
jgi:hypothetical protein